jgi:AraC-like DNA-binding protein
MTQPLLTDRRLPREWVLRVLTLLDAALQELNPEERAAQCYLLEAASHLRQQISPEAAGRAADGGGRLLAWQARKVRDHIDAHITGPVPVADLCAIIQRSETHFSRSFKRTFGVSPHGFVIQRRLELAIRLMLESDICLSDIALQCGFTDQAHLCKHFRHAMGQPPGAWRRAHRVQELRDGMESQSATVGSRAPAERTTGASVRKVCAQIRLKRQEWDGAANFPSMRLQDFNHWMRTGDNPRVRDELTNDAETEMQRGSMDNEGVSTKDGIE